MIIHAIEDLVHASREIMVTNGIEHYSLTIDLPMKQFEEVYYTLGRYAHPTRNAERYGKPEVTYRGMTIRGSYGMKEYRYEYS